MSADELLSRIEELAAELTVQDRPERRAWRRLEPTKKGWPTRPYDDQAFELWTEVLRRFPDDLSAVHHLAIMHHARAIDVEQSDRPRQSDADWRQALAHWHRLFEAEEFWAELSAAVDAVPDPIPQVRQDLAERLVRMHFDIALDEQSPHHRARFHVRLALESPFPADLVERVRKQAYERSTAGVDAAVWRPNTIEPEVLWPAIRTVTGYLERDDDCAAALNDLLRLLTRVQTGQVQQVNGITDPEERRRALDEIRTTSRQYDGYLSRLEALLLRETEPDPLALSNVALWHSRAGQAGNLRGAHDEAAGCYERALRAARAGADLRVEEFRAEWLLSTMLAAREHASDDEVRARRQLDSISESEPLPAFVLMTRAQVWMLLDEFDNADRDVKDALSALDALGAGDDDPWGYDPAELRDECEKLHTQIVRERRAEQVAPFMERARDAIESARWAEAIEALDSVLALDPDRISALLLRARCHLQEYETEAASVDLDRAERLSRVGTGPDQALQALVALRRELTTRHEHVTACGGSRAARLQQQGIRAYNDGLYEHAIQLLRSARAAAHPRPTRKLDEDLAYCLSGTANALVTSIVEGAVNDRPAAAGQAETMLTEALALHRTPATTQYLSQVAELRRLLTGSLL